MTEEQYNQAHTPAVESLHHTGDPELDHLVDEVQHPETEEALQAMACRACGQPLPEATAAGGAS